MYYSNTYLELLLLEARNRLWMVSICWVDDDGEMEDGRTVSVSRIRIVFVFGFVIGQNGASQQTTGIKVRIVIQGHA